jgi:hypothetical protein
MCGWKKDVQICKYADVQMLLTGWSICVLI